MPTLTQLDQKQIDSLIESVFCEINQFHSIEEAAQKLTHVIYHYFKTDEQSDFVLTRVFQSAAYFALPVDIQEKIKKQDTGSSVSTTRYLTLLGTYGDEKNWQARHTSNNHQAIPLTEHTLKTVPMVSRLFQQLGFQLGKQSENEMGELHMSGVSGISGVFYVENALDSPYIPAQDFVKKYGVKSVVGTGVLLPEGEIAAFIGFCRVSLTQAQATILAPIMSKFWRKAFVLTHYGVFS